MDAHTLSPAAFLLLWPLSLWLLLAGALAGLPTLVRFRPLLIFVTLGPPISYLSSLAFLGATRFSLVSVTWADGLALLVGGANSYFWLHCAVVAGLILQIVQRQRFYYERFWIFMLGATAAIAIFNYVNCFVFGLYLFTTLHFVHDVTMGLVPTLACCWISKKLDAREEPTKTAVGGTLS